ncbi:MAG: VOC family protein [Myxococcota bacterium]
MTAAAGFCYRGCVEDKRPLAATGHLFLNARDAGAAARRLVAVGVRKIVLRDDFAVLELRGGTHIVVRERKDDQPTEASFDLMYADLDAAHALFRAEGFEVTEIQNGKIHRSFYATAPEAYRIQVLDSHAGDRPV